MNKLKNNNKNILIYSILTLFNIIMINCYFKIEEIYLNNIMISGYTILILMYILAHFKRFYGLEKVIRIINIGMTVVSLIVYISNSFLINNNFSFEHILESYGNKAIFIYFIVSFLQPIILPLPEPVTIIAGSSVLGMFNGAFFGFLGTLLGIITMYFFVRVTGTKFIDKFINNQYIERFNKYIKRNELIVVLLLFILPILPDEAICIGAGLTNINPYKFISIAMIAKLLTSFSLSYSFSIIKPNIMACIIILILILLMRKMFTFIKNKSIFRAN
ncbi:TVP38/TMEM64 family protein [Clostridium butyricum]